MKTFVYAHGTDTCKALCAGARTFGDVAAIIAAPGAEAPAEAFADDVYLIDLPSGVRPEDAAATIAHLLEQEGAELFLVEATRRGKFIAGSVAALLGTSALVDASSVAEDLTVEHMVYGGAATRTERALGSCAVVLCTPDALPEGDAGGAGAVHAVAFEAPAATIECRSVAPREKAKVDLSAAARVVGVGRGVAAQEDLQLVERFADAIGAEIGCTRPIAEEEKWLPREVYIGVSGAMLSPDLYIGIGLSGQVQHTVGINQAKTIVAINKDASAPIFKLADIGIVGDWKTVVTGALEQLG